MDVFLGSLLLVPYNFVPVGWALCNGQILQISQNTALFSLIGTTFGGDGVTTFALPDHRTQAPNGLTWIIAVQGIFPSRS
jgi:microcystin-dependent protein